MKIAQYIVGLIIVLGLAVPAGIMAFGGEQARKLGLTTAGGASAHAKSQMRAVQRHLRNRPSRRGTSTYRRKRDARMRAFRKNASKWNKSGVVRKRVIRVRYKKVKIRWR